MSNLKLPNITDYASAERHLGSRSSKKIGYQTWLERIDDGVIAVIHHRSQIVIYEKGITYASNAGYGSPTTRDRINKLTPAGVGVFQRDHVQYIQIGDSEPREFHGWVKVA